MDIDVVIAFLIGIVVALGVMAVVEGIFLWVSRNSVDDPFE